MSTFNGSRFIREQVDSILRQTHADFRLIIRDDGSVDDTTAILKEYASADGRVSVLENSQANSQANLGARRSFMHLVSISEAPYFMLADQDDVWLPEKITKSFEKIEEMVRRYGEETPLLVFTDLQVVDENLNEIHPSLWKYQRLDPTISSSWRNLLAQNVVTGCTIIANEAARRAALPFAWPGMMHDHWIAVNAARSGHVGFLDETTVLYRQHAANVEGSKNFGVAYAADKTKGLRARFAEYQKAAAHFGGISVTGLMLRKINLNLKRFWL